MYYSYGILLMETFTGKKPTDEMFAGEMNLKWWVRESLLITHEVIEVIDENLLGQRQEDDLFLGKKDCILSIMELCLECSAALPEEKPCMEVVLSRLKNIKMKFLRDIGLA